MELLLVTTACLALLLASLWMLSLCTLTLFDERSHKLRISLQYM